MADDLLLSGGGSTAVESAHLLDLAARLRALAFRLDDWLHRLQGLDACRGDPGAQGAARCLRTAGELAHDVEVGIRRAAEAYGSLERELTEQAERWGAAGGYLLGLLSPVLAAVGFVWLWSAGPAALVALAAAGGPKAVRRAIQTHRGVLSDPRFVAFVRLAVSSADDAMLGAGRVPPLLARLGDDRRLGWFGRKGATATIVTAFTALGLGLQETPVTVRRAEALRAPAPSGYRELAARIPGSAPGSPQVRVERYARADGTSWIVYVGGTIDTAFRTGEEPFDDTSNLYASAGLDAGSVRVAERALQEAGAQPGDKLLAVGYSQGGIVASELVRNDGYDPVGLVTFGAPTAGVSLPRGVDEVAVEHTDDVIPALGGMPLGADEGGLERTLVRRRVLDDLPPRPDEGLPAHALARYRDTARELDACADERLNRIRATLARDFGGGDADVSLWRGTRVASRDEQGLGGGEPRR